MPVSYNGWTSEKLKEFEEEIKEEYLKGRIKAPVHFIKGNEQQLIDIFSSQGIDNKSWVFSTHRSHFPALLKGIPREWLKNEIMEGRSIGIYNAEYRFFSSAIVGGCLPIAVGVAMAAKIKQTDDNVWVFVGDMAAETGIFYECTKYAARNEIPINFVIDDDGLSVNTPTQKSWGESGATPMILRYRFDREVPHQGCGQWVVF